MRWNMAGRCGEPTLDRTTREGLSKEVIFDLKFMAVPLEQQGEELEIENGEYWKFPETRKSLVFKKQQGETFKMEEE